jgi:hypothetical protein
MDVHNDAMDAKGGVVFREKEGRKGQWEGRRGEDKASTRANTLEDKQAADRTAHESS